MRATAIRMLGKAQRERIKGFNKHILALLQYDLVDIMIALAEQRGGTTPLYEAVEEATEEMS